MISGDELRDARSRAGLTQEQLAKRVGTSQRSIGNWERGDGVPRNSEAKVRDILGQHLTSQATDQLSGESDVALIAELGRRLAERTKHPTLAEIDAIAAQRQRDERRQQFLSDHYDDPDVEPIAHQIDRLRFEADEAGGLLVGEEYREWAELWDEIDFRAALEDRHLPYPKPQHRRGHAANDELAARRRAPKPVPADIAEAAADAQDEPTAREANRELGRQDQAGQEDQDGPGGPA